MKTKSEILFQHFSNRRQIVNIHIPKTAGTTFRAQLQKVFPLVPIDLGGPGDNPELPYFERFRSILQNTQSRVENHEDYFVSGHFRYRDLSAAAPSLFAKASVTTFLRNPISRMLSDYYYSISEAHPGAAAFIASYPDFETYMRSPGESNKQLEYLKADGEDSVDQTIERIGREFAFVGVTETYDICEKWFFNHVGRPVPASAHLNKNLNRSKMQEGRERYAEELREILRPEFRLYNHFKNIWQNAG